MKIYKVVILLFCTGYLLTGFSQDSEEIMGSAYLINASSPGNINVVAVDMPEVWVAVGRVTIAATRQAVAVTRVYTPEAGNLARAARISIAIVFNFNKHIQTNFPEDELQREFRMWELDNA